MLAKLIFKVALYRISKYLISVLLTVVAVCCFAGPGGGGGTGHVTLLSSPVTVLPDVVADK